MTVWQPRVWGAYGRDISVACACVCASPPRCLQTMLFTLWTSVCPDRPYRHGTTEYEVNSAEKPWVSDGPSTPANPGSL